MSGRSYSDFSVTYERTSFRSSRSARNKSPSIILQPNNKESLRNLAEAPPEYHFGGIRALGAAPTYYGPRFSLTLTLPRGVVRIFFTWCQWLWRPNATSLKTDMNHFPLVGDLKRLLSNLALGQRQRRQNCVKL